MQIYDISIRNFRGIRLLENLRVGEINSFVGKNDSGKSNILKALDLFFNEKFDSNDVYKGIADGEKTELILRFNPPKEINKLATDEEGKIKLRKTFEFNSAGKVVKGFSYFCYDINDENFSNCWGLKESDINNCGSQLGLDFSRSGRGITNLSKIEEIDAATSELGRVEKEYNDANTYLKNLKKQYDFIDIPLFSLFDAEQDLNVSSTSFQNQFKPIAQESLDNNSELTSQIEKNVQNDLENEFSIITELMKKNVPDLEKINTYLNCNWKNLVKFDLSLKFSSEKFDIPISNKGTGFKRLLMVAYFEYLAQKNSKRYQIFGIEEPETFLHPALQKDLLDSIIELSDNNQFFLTTHSPVFAGATKKSNITVVRKENEQSKYFNFENEDDILNMVINELGIKPSYNLLNDDYDKAVFVEGSGDVKFWQIALNKINGSIPENILFIPCGGDQVEFFVNAELCRKINRKFIVILDSDKGAVDYESKLENKRKLIEKITELGGTTHLLRKREIENYYCRDAVQRILGNSLSLPEDFTIGDYNDIKEEVKRHIIGTNFKAKNNFKVFEEMTKDEWISSGFKINGKTDIEEIITEILS